MHAPEDLRQSLEILLIVITLGRWGVTTGIYRLEPKDAGRVSYAAHVTVQRRKSAAAAAKSPQSCLTPCDPIDGSPPGSPVPGILQARTLEWVVISFSNA